MTMRVTMREPRRSEDGLTFLLAGATYTVSDQYGEELVRNGFATDVDGALVRPPDGLTLTEVASARALLSAAGNSLTLVKSSGYHLHAWAPTQSNGDTKLYDYSGALNDASFQANLTAANAWATAGFLTQANPVTSGQLTLVEIPALGWDFVKGDSLLIFWRGRATPEGTSQPIMGDTSGTAANGIRVLCTAAGKVSFNLYQQSGALSRFGGTSAVTVFDASVTHSFAICLDGATGRQCLWSDGAREAAFASGFAALSGGGAIDTLTAATLKLGGDGSTNSGVQNGLGVQTQALVILKGRRGRGVPNIADLDRLVSDLHRNPAPLVSAAYW